MTSSQVQRVGAAAMLVFGFAWALRPIGSIDVFMHVAIGREILANGVPATDVFSAIDPTAPWSPFQAAYEVLVAWVDARNGLDGLRVLHAAAFGVAFAAFFRFVVRQAGGWITSLCLLTVFLVLFDERIRLRPHMFNLLFETIFLLPLAAGAWRRARLPWAALCVGVAFVWASLHAMAVMWLLAMLGAWLVGGRDRDERLWAAGTGALSLVAVLAAPGALDGILHVWQIQDDWLPFVPELEPSWVFFRSGTAYGLLCATLPLLACAAVVAAALSRPARDRWGTILIAAGLAFGSVWMVRLGYYAAFVFVLLLPELRRLADALPRRPGAWPLALATLGLAAVLLEHVLGRFAYAEVRDPWRTTLYPETFPVAEATLLRASGIEGRIFNEPAWGGYLLYTMHPPSTVVGDGRITFSQEAGALIQEAAKPRRRLWAATEAHKRFGVDLIFWRASPRPQKGAPKNRMCTQHERKLFCWERILWGEIAEVWSPEGPLTEARRAALARAQGPGR